MPSQFLKVALDAARNAEEIITAYYTDDAMKVELKADETPVTLADRGAEKVIRGNYQSSVSRSWVFRGGNTVSKKRIHLTSGSSIRLMRRRITSEKSRSSVHRLR